MGKSAYLKPFHLEKKATVSRWEHVIMQNLRKEDKWALVLNIEWNQKNPNFKGFTENDDAAKQAKSNGVDAMLAYITQYAH